MELFAVLFQVLVAAEEAGIVGLVPAMLVDSVSTVGTAAVFSRCSSASSPDQASLLPIPCCRKSPLLSEILSTLGLQWSSLVYLARAGSPEWHCCSLLL